MWQAIAGIIQILYLLLKNKFEKDEELRKKRAELHAEVKDTIASRDTSRINDLVKRMRQ